MGFLFRERTVLRMFIIVVKWVVFEFTFAVMFRIRFLIPSLMSIEEIR